MADEMIYTVDVRFEVNSAEQANDLAKDAARWAEGQADMCPGVRYNVGTDRYVSGQVGFSEAMLFDIVARVRALLAREDAARA